MEASNMYLFGFDGFGQLSAFNKGTGASRLKDVKSVSFSWTNCLICCKTEGQDPRFYLTGLKDQKKKQREELTLPVNNDKIVDGAINTRTVLVLTKNHEIWRFTLWAKKWDNITPILFAQLDGGTRTEENEAKVSKILISEGINIALLTNGVILNIPNVITGDPLKFEIAEIAVGIDHAVFLSKDGLVFTYGSGGRGQLGHGELENDDNLREVRALSGIRISQVAAAGWHCVARSYCGDLYGWGWNNWGQLSICPEEKNGAGDFKGMVVSEPTLMNWPNDDANVTSVACGTRHTVAVLDDGSVWGCGWNGHDQLPGLDFNKNAIYPLMSQLKLPRKNQVKEISCGGWNSAFWFSE